jgi:hypothetical protein
VQHAIEGGSGGSFGDRSFTRMLSVGENRGTVAAGRYRNVNSLPGFPVGVGEAVVAEEVPLHSADKDFCRRPVDGRGQFAVRFQRGPQRLDNAWRGIGSDRYAGEFEAERARRELLARSLGFREQDRIAGDGSDLCGEPVRAALAAAVAREDFFLE